MLFNSPIFLFFFLPIVLLCYYAVGKKYKNLILLLFSLLFYTWGEKELVVLIIASSLVDYTCGIMIENGRRKLGLWLSILFNLGILFSFKYFNFTVDNLVLLSELLAIDAQTLKSVGEVVLPLGISFYTFQTMSYTIDVYRGNVKANRNFIDFATYVTLFPQLIAGPIIRYKDIHLQLENRSVSPQKFAEGVERFTIGLAKKMLIANNSAFLADAIFSLPAAEVTMPLGWLGVLAYSIQIYYDFSGYSDMAIGLGKMFGFDFLENFNYPYISKTIQEFWRRWHISLSTWFKEYLYIPLGGNRLSSTRTYLNLMLVFLVTGLWHGASWTFVVWALIHGAFIVLEKIWLGSFLAKRKVLSHAYMLFVIFTSWPFFRSESISEALRYCQNMFAFNFDLKLEFLSFYLNTEVWLALLFGVIFAMPAYNKVWARRKSLAMRYALLMLVFMVSAMYVSNDTYNPFIYFRF